MLYEFEKVIYKGNFKRDFYLFCLKKKYKIITKSINILFLNILFRLKLIDNEKYLNHYFSFIKYFDIKKLTNDFFENKKDKIDSRFLLELEGENITVVTTLPDVLVKPFFKGFNIKNYIASKWNLKESKIKKISEVDLKIKYQRAFLTRGSVFLTIDNVEEKFVKYFKKNILYKKYKGYKKIIEKTFLFILIIVLTLFLTFINFAFSLPVSDLREILNYFTQIDIFLLNYFPIFLLIIFLYFVFGKIAFSFAVSSIFITLFSFINKTKLGFREEPFWFNDLKLFFESYEMAKRYPININLNLILLIFFIIITSFVLNLLYKNKIKLKYRFLGSLVSLVVIIFSYNLIFINSEIYSTVGNKENINIWSTKEQFVIRGFIYPFIYSSTESKLIKPKGYNKKQVEKELADMESHNIDDNQKINIIAIMLEAYNDFTKFDIDLNEVVYQKYLKIKNESYFGTIISNVFGGGTINTERSFLTGYSDFPDFRLNTNSFAWYFKNQGYNVDASHPVYGWFYNRNNVNPKLGFDNFYSYYNKYNSMQDDFLNDHQFFDDIKNNFSFNKGKPYFHFAVTYQNHGPYYTGIETDFEYLKRDNFLDEATYNMLNNYFKGISYTNDALSKLVNSLKIEKEPVILVLFGDHNPYLGEGHLGYNALGIDLVSNSEEAYLNKYEVPYLFWANDSAKAVTNKTFKGQGETISPMFLMAELFDYLGWKGNQFMQILTDLKRELPTFNSSLYYEKDNFINSLGDELTTKLDKYNNYSYYFATNFSK